ncbi:hypothetical protein GA840_02260 [Pediococcus ethanolidurans]|uniref:hypothetical protein n=1 Tax=Pediococcus ethanolidurans TaxID=319653 RepID=UPI002954BA84|nr:hypothetical protein [Pediococcus ethanolidurans]MDV7718694.1 hypothetical protein [Pediococcus ethanolidurans]
MNTVKKFLKGYLQPVVLFGLITLFWIYHNNSLSNNSFSGLYSVSAYVPFLVTVILLGWSVWQKKWEPLLTAITMVLAILVCPPFKIVDSVILAWVLVPTSSYLLVCTILNKRSFRSFIVLGIMLIGIIGMFATPKTAVRMGVATNGHPMIAMTAKVAKNNYRKNHDQYTKRGDYVIKPSFVDKATGARYDEFSMHCEGFFYVATLNYKVEWM